MNIKINHVAHINNIKSVFITFKILLVLALLSTIACGNEASPDNTTIEKKEHNTSHAVSVVDAQGSTIRLEQPAQRIIALAPHAVENVYSAGAGDRLVGVVKFSYFPDEAKKLPIVGGYKELNLERIIELQPDLIIAWESGNSHNSYTRLQKLGFNVYVDQPNALNDVAKSIIDIGILSGTEQHARHIADDYLRKLDIVRTKNKDKALISLFYQVWNQPLRTINGKHIISDAMSICGGTNIYADEIPIAPVINIESIIERDPEAIFASGMSSARPEWLDDWKEWPSLQAVQKDNLFFVDPDHIQRHTVRLLLAIEAICEQLELARSK